MKQTSFKPTDTGNFRAPVIAILVSLLSYSALAQNTLNDWLAQAMASNPQIAAARQRWEAARQKIPQASALMDPMVGAELMRDGATGFGDYDMVEWMVSQPLPGFGKRGARRQAAARETEAAGLEYLETIRSVRAGVIASYWTLWAARERERLAREAVAVAEQFEQAALACCEAGTGNQSDVLRAQIERTTLEDERITRSQQVRVARAAVNALLNAPPDTPRDTGDPGQSPEALPDPGVLLERAAGNNAMLVARARRVEARRALLKAARREYAPDVEVFAKARQPRGGGGIQEYDTGIALNFPWLWRGKTKGMIGEARAELAAAEAEYSDAANRLSVEILDRHAEADAAARRIGLFKAEILEKTRQLVETSLAEYQAGRADFFALLDAQREAIRVEAEYIDARAEHGRAMAGLNQMTTLLADHEKEIKP
ncbi:MAG: Cobalt-zinc-cadmium resistance protein CzcC precursor [Verrucomicrobia bacterium ADurb.Bin345]|nr:MAG: Cobalt-zinc-cadmium resistance protein CzcC precursor [Verrucomicrobia bacterium ADurb.Bin345]